MKKIDILSPLTTISGIITFSPVEQIVSIYALVITIVCGTVSLFRITLHAIRSIKKYRHGKLTLDEAIKEFDEMEKK